MLFNLVNYTNIYLILPKKMRYAAMCRFSTNAPHFVEPSRPKSLIYAPKNEIAST